MLFKKGDPSSVDNCRPITLLICLVKIFTLILSLRFTSWAENSIIIPEFQAGLRVGRGCIDNLFTLGILIELHLRRSKNAVYAVFVDFKGAFPSIVHDLLWYKLKKLGVSSK